MGNQQGTNGTPRGGVNCFGTWQLCYGERMISSSSLTASLNIKYNVQFATLYDNAYLKVDGTTIISESGQSATTYNCYIFADNWGIRNSKTKVCAKVYGAKIKNHSGTLVRNFVPARRVSDSVVGLYDLVNSKFYTNSGSGTFIAGPAWNYVTINSDGSITKDGNFATGEYVLFGEFPKTIKASTVKIDENTKDSRGYYKGSDGEWYARVKANVYIWTSGGTITDDGSKMSDGSTITSGTEYYFKVEPIKWKILKVNNDGTLLLYAEDILTANIPFYTSESRRIINSKTVYANNYEYSTIRAYLNSANRSSWSVGDYSNTGFLTTAFTTSEQGIISTTIVGNSASTTNSSSNSYACSNTNDKIFLLSYQDLINSSYGYNTTYSDYDTARRKKPTDYAKANYAAASTDTSYLEGGHFWLRSPSTDGEARVWFTLKSGMIEKVYALDSYIGIVPALTLDLREESYLSSNWKTRLSSANSNITASTIKTVTFTNEVPSGYTKLCSVGTNSATVTTAYTTSTTIADVTAYYKTNTTTSGTYDIVIYSPVKIYAPQNCTELFFQCYMLSSIDFGTNFDTSKVTTMNYMFEDCSSLTTLDLSNFNTSSVTDMGYMFFGSYGLTTLNLSNFNTSNVTDMRWMFSGCSSLTTLDLSTFNTSSVGSMYNMFFNCSKLTTLNVSSFNTSSVTNMSGMFYNCSSLTSLNLSNFNTSLVTTMYQMFYNCSSLTSLTFGTNFDTSKVTTMQGMFYYCSKLTSLDVSNFNTELVTNIQSMFEKCSSLTSLNVSNFNTAKVTTMAYMFKNCSSLATLNISNFNMTAVTNTTEMFYSCTGLTTLKAPYNVQSSYPITLPANFYKETNLFSGSTSTITAGSVYCSSANTKVTLTRGYVVKFNANNGTSSTQYQGLPDGKGTLNNVTFTKTGYTQGNWNTATGGTGTTYAKQASITTALTADLVLYAQWTANKYTITYKDKGDATFSGTHASGYPTTHTWGTATTLKTASKTGYTFGGWFTDTFCLGSAVTTIGATAYLDAITLYAKWTANVYSITYKDQNNATFSGTHASGYPTAHTYGTATTLKTASKTGYTFGGWFTTSACSGTAITSLGATAYTSNITLYAQWTANVYTITYVVYETMGDYDGNVEWTRSEYTGTYTYDQEKTLMSSSEVLSGKKYWLFFGWFEQTSEGLDPSDENNYDCKLKELQANLGTTTIAVGELGNKVFYGRRIQALSQNIKGFSDCSVTIDINFNGKKLYNINSPGHVTMKYYDEDLNAEMTYMAIIKGSKIEFKGLKYAKFDLRTNVYSRVKIDLLHAVLDLRPEIRDQYLSITYRHVYKGGIWSCSNF